MENEEIAEVRDLDVITKSAMGFGLMPDLPGEVLSLLSSDPEVLVRWAVSMNPETSVDLLRVLASDPDPRVRRAVASNASTPDTILSGMANNDQEEVEVLAAVARNSRTPSETLVMLATTTNEVIVETAVAHNLRATSEVLEEIPLNHMDVAIAVARNPKTPESVLSDLVDTFDGDVQYLVLRHPLCSRGLLGEIADEWEFFDEEYDDDQEDFPFRAALARHPNATPKMLQQLASASDPLVLMSLIGNEATPKSAIKRLGAHPSPLIQAAVARRTESSRPFTENTPDDFVSDCFRELEADSHWVARVDKLNEYDSVNLEDWPPQDVWPTILWELLAEWPDPRRAVIGSSPSVPITVLESLSRDQDSDVRVAVAGNPRTPGPVLEALLADESTCVQAAVLSNPAFAAKGVPQAMSVNWNVADALMGRHQVPHWVLSRLARIEDFEVLELLALHPDAPGRLIAELALSPFKEARVAVCSRSDVTRELLELLSNDAAPDVRAAVASAQRTPEACLRTLAVDRSEIVRRSVGLNPAATEEIRALTGNA